MKQYSYYDKKRDKVNQKLWGGLITSEEHERKINAISYMEIMAVMKELDKKGEYDLLISLYDALVTIRTTGKKSSYIPRMHYITTHILKEVR